MRRKLRYIDIPCYYAHFGDFWLEIRDYSTVRHVWFIALLNRRAQSFFSLDYSTSGTLCDQTTVRVPFKQNSAVTTPIYNRIITATHRLSAKSRPQLRKDVMHYTVLVAPGGQEISTRARV